MRLVLTLALLAVSAPAQAQLLTSGTWTGTLTDGRTPRPATAAIERCATGFSVALTSGGRTVRTETATYSRGQMTFELPGYRSSARATPRTLQCTTQIGRDGRMTGMCTGSRAPIRLVLAPPANGELGCS